jgi:membrane protease YdiL (CAAX protease family)
MNQTQDNSKHHQVFLLTLIGLLILRIPFEASMRFFNIEWEWTFSVYQIGTYLLTTFLVWWELDNLAEYHIDTLAVIIIILFKPIQTLMALLWNFGKYFLAFPGIPSLMIWIIAIAFAVGIWRKRSKLPSIKSRDIGWLLIGIIAGLLTMIVLSYPMSFQVLEGAKHENILIGFFYQIGQAAISEEPLFRGFLWGFLKKLKWREVWIWLFQAGLFTFSHIYYVNTYPISFWIIVPVCSLVLGWLAWRSRTITSSMVAHGMMNGSGNVFGYMMYLYRLG